MVDPFVWKLLIALLVFMSVGITSVAVANNQVETECNNQDPTIGMDLQRYLWTYGVVVMCYSTLVIPFVWLLSLCVSGLNDDSCGSQSFRFFAGLCAVAFLVYDVIWTVLGGVTIFRSNIGCFPGNSMLPICSLIILSINGLFILACVIIGICLWRLRSSNSYASGCCNL